MEIILSKFIPRLHNMGSAYFWTYLITLHLWDLSICHSVPLCHSADGNSRCLTFPRVPTLPPSLPPSLHPATPSTSTMAYLYTKVSSAELLY